MRYLYYFETIACIILAVVVPAQLDVFDNSKLPAFTVDGMRRLGEANIRITNALLKFYEQENPYCTTILSSIPLVYNLGISAIFTASDSDEQKILNFLNMENVTQIEKTYPEITKEIITFTDVISSWVFGAFADAKYPFEADFIKNSLKVTNGPVQNLYFDDAENVEQYLNLWTRVFSNDTVNSDVVHSSAIASDNRLIFITPSYFTGEWVYPFKRSHSENQDFEVCEKNFVHVPRIESMGYYRYAELHSMDAKIVEIYYKGGNFSLLLIIPNHVDGLPYLLEKINKPGAFQNVLEKEGARFIKISLPKIILRRQNNMLQKLWEINPDIYHMVKSPILYNVFKGNQTAYISNIIHRIHIKIDEGTDYEACNSDEYNEYAYEPLHINVKNSFLFYILCDKRIPIYGGIYTGVDCE